MLTANFFAAALPALPDSLAQPKVGRSGLMPKLLVALMLLTATLWQATGTTLAQESPPAAGETTAAQSDDTAAATDGGVADEATVDASVTGDSTEKTALGLDAKIDARFGEATGWFVMGIFYGIPVMEGVKIPWVLFPLVLGAVFFTLAFGFPNIRYFGTALNIVRGKYDSLEGGGGVTVSDQVSTVDGDNPDTVRVEGHEGEVSHFQALTAALSGTVGLGNIAGVAIALSIGGPGATFWMIVCGLLGMSTKFAECTLGVTFREIDSKGTVFGGPMYYLSKGLEEKGWGIFGKILGKILAILFAIMCIGGSFGGGNMVQANQAFKLFSVQTGIGAGYGWLFGLVMAIFVGIVIIGGIKSIANVTDKIVPLMVGIYVVAAISILVIKVGLIPQAVSTIIAGAFNPTAIAGGIVGVIVQGFKRAAFSNEAGIGSASIAHSAVKTKYPASEGLVALLEPFIDTVVVCTMTALVIVISNFDGSVMSYGVEVGDQTKAVVATSGAFAATIPWFPWVMMVAVTLFAFSTMISWSYYGYQAWSYLFGRSKALEYVYKAIFCVFVVIGSAASLKNVLDFSDAMIFAMLVPNMIGLFFLFPRVKEELSKYMAAIKASK